MSIEKTGYRKFENAYTITSGDAKIVVVADIGPRVLSVTLGDGPNLVFDDVDEAIEFEGWKIYGGHRFWLSPETILTYAPDVEPCEATIDGEQLVVAAPVDSVTNLQKLLVVQAAPKGFILSHILTNVGDFLAPETAIWGLTCMRPTGVCAIPWRSGPEKWSTAMIRFWARWADHTSDLESKQWRQTRDLYEVHPTGEEGEIGSRSEHAWIAQWTDEATFIKQGDFLPGANYPDDGCNLELYTCAKFIELETLSPTATLRPGESLVHHERWLVVPPMERSLAAVDALLCE